MNNHGSLPPLHIWTNKIIHRAILKQELAKMSEKVYSEIFILLQENLPLAHLDLLVMNDFNGFFLYNYNKLNIKKQKKYNKI